MIRLKASRPKPEEPPSGPIELPCEVVLRLDTGCTE